MTLSINPAALYNVSSQQLTDRECIYITSFYAYSRSPTNTELDKLHKEISCEKKK